LIIIICVISVPFYFLPIPSQVIKKQAALRVIPRNGQAESIIPYKLAE
jgi:hypothetical protein